MIEQKNKSILLELSEKTKNRFVLHEHQRGISSHLDFRFEINNHLIGFTLNDPIKIGNQLNFCNDKNSKIIAELKYKHPLEWLSVEGSIERGEIGATKQLPVRFKILDQGDYEIGTQKENMFEVFLLGKKYQGRIIFKKMLNTDKLKIAGNDNKTWKVWKPMDQSPYVLSNESISEKWIPQTGRSTMSKDWEEKIPMELRWWENQWTEKKILETIKSIRKLLIKRNILQKGKDEIVMQPLSKSNKLKDINLSEWQIGAIYNLTTLSELSLSQIATKVGCSKSSITTWQKKLGLR